MRLLALDTSSSVATVAVMEDEKLIVETIINYKKTHSEKLMPLIEEVLGHCDLKPKDIDLFAASLGPGSFTGLRIGITTIKAMAQALDKPVVGVSALEGLAYNLAFAKGLICPIIDAQRETVYTALYKWEKTGLEEVMEQRVMPVEELINHLHNIDETIIFIGDAVDKFRDQLQANLLEKSYFPSNNFIIPRASSIAELARKKALRKEIAQASEVIPIYMRKSQAENQYEERMKGKEGQ